MLPIHAPNIANFTSDFIHPSLSPLTNLKIASGWRCYCRVLIYARSYLCNFYTAKAVPTVSYCLGVCPTRFNLTMYSILSFGYSNCRRCVFLTFLCDLSFLNAQFHNSLKQAITEAVTNTEKPLSKLTVNMYYLYNTRYSNKAAVIMHPVFQA